MKFIFVAALSRVGSSTCCLSDFLNALAFVGAMVVVGRLEWVLAKIRSGHRVLVTSSFNSELQKQKLKVLIQPISEEVPYSEMNQCCAFAAITNMLHLAKPLKHQDVLHFMDRGHRHSSGVSEVCLWMEIRKAKENKEAAVTVVDGEALDVEGTSSSAADGAIIGGTETSANNDLGCFAWDSANSGISGSGAVVACGDGEDVPGVGVGEGVPEPCHRMSNSVRGTGSICQSIDNKEDVVNQPKRARLLVEM